MSLVFIDTETLGLDPDYQPIWEIGLILPDGTEREWHLEVTPRAIALAHPYALEINRFEERYGKEHEIRKPASVVREIADLIPADSHLVGAIVSFDEERLRRLMWEHGQAPRWHYHIVDVEALAAGYEAGRRRMAAEMAGGGAEVEVLAPPWESEDLSRFVGVDPAQYDKHTALGDARWAKGVWEAVMGPVG